MYFCIVDSSFVAVGMFGDRWQKRYFILHGPKLSYFKKYGVSLVYCTIHCYFDMS